MLLISIVFGLFIALPTDLGGKVRNVFGTETANTVTQNATKSINDQTKVANEQDTTSINVPESDPHAPTIGKVLTLFPNYGFRLQPQSVVNLTVGGSSKTIHPETVIPDLKSLDGYKISNYQWRVYDATTQSWRDATAQDKDLSGVNSNDLTVSPSVKPDTRYVQLCVTFNEPTIWGISSKDHLVYSTISRVNTFAQANKASYLEVEPDDNFLYNNQNYEDATYVHAIPTPANATGDVKWSSSDNKIASVNANGLVSPISDPSGSSKNVTISGSIKNLDGTETKGSTDITVGGGLSDKSVETGHAATFTIQGTRQNDMSSIQSVKWYRIDPNNGASQTPRQVSSGMSLQYTTPNTRLLPDNGAKYYAVVSFNGTSNQIITNQAKLGVYNLDNNKIKYSSFSIYNNTSSNKDDTKRTLTNVKSTDLLYLDMTVTDLLNGSKDNGPLSIQLPAGAKVTSVLTSNNDHQFDTYIDANGKKVYKTQMTDDPKVDTITDHHCDFDQAGATFYRIYFHIPYDDPYLNFTGHATYSPTSEHGIFYGNFDSPDYSINLLPELFELKAQSIDFGNLLPFKSGQELTGKVNDPNSMVLQVIDKRSVSDRTPKKVFVSADPNFVSQNGKVLNTNLKLDNNGVEEPLGLDEVALAETRQGQAVPSIYWKNKLKLIAPDQLPGEGKYKTTLTWTVADSV